MTAPLNLKEGQLSIRPPRFNEKFYSWWKTNIMTFFLMVKDSQLWNIMLDGPHVPTLEVKNGEITQVVPKD